MDRTIARAVTDKKPVPEIDFTLHVMEDGTQVSTLERVIKGNATMFFFIPSFYFIIGMNALLITLWSFRGASAGVEHPAGRPVLVS